MSEHTLLCFAYKLRPCSSMVRPRCGTLVRSAWRVRARMGRPRCPQVWDYAMYIVIVLLTLAAFAAYGDSATVGTSLQVLPLLCCLMGQRACSCM